MKERKTGIGRRKFYIAYGSNLDMDQMRRRCPTARPYYPYCSGWLNNWELIYRGSKSGNYATIRKAKGKYVPVGVWLITREDERALDKYEGYPVFYQKYKLPVALQSGETIECIVYIMRPDAAVGVPTERYVDTIYRGYGDFDLDYRYLMDSLILNLNEVKKERP